MKAIIFDYGGKPCQIELLDKIYDKVYSSFTEEGIPSWHNEFGASCILCKLARSSCGECVLVTVTGRSCVEIEQVRAAVDARYTVLDRLSPLMYAEMITDGEYENALSVLAAFRAWLDEHTFSV